MEQIKSMRSQAAALSVARLLKAYLAIKKLLSENIPPERIKPSSKNRPRIKKACCKTKVRKPWRMLRNVLQQAVARRSPPTPMVTRGQTS